MDVKVSHCEAKYKQVRRSEAHSEEREIWISQTSKMRQKEFQQLQKTEMQRMCAVVWMQFQGEVYGKTDNCFHRHTELIRTRPPCFFGNSTITKTNKTKIDGAEKHQDFSCDCIKNYKKKLEKSLTSCINTAECCMLKITLPKLSSSCCKKNKEVVHILPVQTQAASDWA